MSIRKDDSGKRWVQAEVIVPGTPEEVWAAIASGEGVSAWFFPTEKRDDGTIVTHFGPGMDAIAKETAWEPPRRFAGESEMGPGGPTMATEWSVEARSGGTCLVRVVHSLFASTDDWDDQLGAIESGWPDYFELLRLYLTHFRGQPCSGFQLLSMVCEPSDVAWEKIATNLMLGDMTAGPAQSPDTTAISFAGIIERSGTTGHPHQALVRLNAPAPGLAHLFADQRGSQVVVSIRFYLYGQSAAKTVELQEPAWHDWMNRLFPAQPSATPSLCAPRSMIEARAVHHFTIPAEAVYDAWLDPAKVRAWMSSSLKSCGLPGEIRRAEITPQVGGTFCFSDMRNGTEAVHRGTYLELVRPSKIVFTWIVGEESPDENTDDPPSRVSLTIEPDGMGCRATIIHEMDARWADFVTRTEQGWKRMLLAIEGLAANLV